MTSSLGHGNPAVMGYRDGIHPPAGGMLAYSHGASTPTSRQAVAVGSPLTRTHGAIPGSPAHPGEYCRLGEVIHGRTVQEGVVRREWGVAIQLIL